MNKTGLIDRVNRHRTFFRFAFSAYNKLPFNNSFRGAKISFGLSYIKKCKIRSHGKNNKIIVGDFSRLIGCTISIRGNNNTIRIGDRCLCRNAVFCIEDDNNTIEVGDETAMHGEISLSVIEGTAITIGRECLFSSKINIRTGDSHSLVQKGTMNRINPSRSIDIGDHVWIGMGVTILKGTRIADHCVVGAASLLNKVYERPNCVIAGVPAKEVKENVDWVAERI